MVMTIEWVDFLLESWDSIDMMRIDIEILYPSKNDTWASTSVACVLP